MALRRIPRFRERTLITFGSQSSTSNVCENNKTNKMYYTHSAIYVYVLHYIRCFLITQRNLLNSTVRLAAKTFKADTRLCNNDVNGKLT